MELEAAPITGSGVRFGVELDLAGLALTLRGDRLLRRGERGNRGENAGGDEREHRGTDGFAVHGVVSGVNGVLRVT